MSPGTIQPRCAGALGALAVLGLAGCVESFGGSNLQVTLASSVHVPGLPATGGRPPPGTHYSFYAVQVDAAGGASYSFKVADFEIHPMVDPASPCFIEDDRSPFPGLHVTRLPEKLREATGIADPFSPPEGASAEDVSRILLADDRIANLSAIATSMKAVSGHSPAAYPPVGAACAGQPGAVDGEIPPPSCTDDASNLARRRACEAFWAEHPEHYEGNDKVFTAPLNGDFHGAVDGTDPRNGSLVGGLDFLVPANLAGIDALLVTWQYDCAPDDHAARGDDCDPLFPPGLPEAERSPTGVVYLAGEAEQRTLGVTHVSLSSGTFPQLAGEVAIWTDLDRDDVQF